jgi:predicted NUDIX family phosphoesterase
MMKENKLVEVTKPIRLELLEDKFILPPQIQAKVDAFWEGLVREKPYYRRGEAFTIANICEKKDVIEVKLALTDYAHYIYTRAVGLPKELAFNNLHTSCTIETADGVLIFGLTGENTAKIGIVQCVGGGLDRDDVRGNEIDLEHNIKKELQEEVGIDANDEKAASSLKLSYLKYTFNEKFSSIAAIFYLKLNLSEKEFLAQYEEFEKELREKGQVPELQKIICLPKKEEVMRDFLRNHKSDSLDLYMEALLEKLISEDNGENPNITDNKSEFKSFSRLA